MGYHSKGTATGLSIVSWTGKGNQNVQSEICTRMEVQSVARTVRCKWNFGFIWKSNLLIGVIISNPTGNGRRGGWIVLYRHSTIYSWFGVAIAWHFAVCVATIETRPEQIDLVEPITNRQFACQRISLHIPASQRVQTDIGICVLSEHQFQ